MNAGAAQPPSTNKPIIAVCGATGMWISVILGPTTDLILFFIQGFQGGSVVDHLLRDGRFAVRALTRKPAGFQAQGKWQTLPSTRVQLTKELVLDLQSLCVLGPRWWKRTLTTRHPFAAPLRVQSSNPFEVSEILTRGALGCYGAFGVTDYFEAFEREAQQGINMVEAAKAANLKHLVIGYARAITGNGEMTDSRAALRLQAKIPRLSRSSTSVYNLCRF